MKLPLKNLELNKRLLILLDLLLPLRPPRMLRMKLLKMLKPLKAKADEAAAYEQARAQEKAANAISNQAASE